MSRYIRNRRTAVAVLLAIAAVFAVGAQPVTQLGTSSADGGYQGGGGSFGGGGAGGSW